MDKAFPDCKQLNAEYTKCFASKPFQWGTASGDEEDPCSDLFEAFHDCVNKILDDRKADKAEKDAADAAAAAKSEEAAKPR
ncbi:hypothetical protein M885DRAFT_539346 [Pelagophyceae sp. CCMP2097]|nr:hypothetical protein M885DRAFT_539346 [Pelagophyceae sp. CCMP2097]